MFFKLHLPARIGIDRHQSVAANVVALFDMAVSGQMPLLSPARSAQSRRRALFEDLGAEAAGGGGVGEFCNHHGGKIFNVFTKLEI